MTRAVWVGGIVLLASCARQSPEVPPRIRYGEDTCAACRMIISEMRFAGALMETDGAVRLFDDVGCLLRALPERVAAVWVHDVQTEQWLPAETAYVLSGGRIITPMSSGLVVVGNREAAEALRGHVGGTILRWPEAQALTIQDGARR